MDNEKFGRELANQLTTNISINDNEIEKVIKKYDIKIIAIAIRHLVETIEVLNDFDSRDDGY